MIVLFCLDGLNRLPDADSVKHEPSRFLSYSNCPTEFVTADPIPAVGDCPHGDKPLVETEWTILENGSDLEAELLLTSGLVALDLARSGRHFLAGIVATSWADDLTTGPLDLTHEIVAVGRCREVSGCFQQRFGDRLNHYFSMHGRPACPDDLMSVCLILARRTVEIATSSVRAIAELLCDQSTAGHAMWRTPYTPVAIPLSLRRLLTPLGVSPITAATSVSLRPSATSNKNRRSSIDENFRWLIGESDSVAVAA